MTGGERGDGEGTRSESARLTVDDLAALADEASRQSLSLACLVGAMDDGAEIAWMATAPTYHTELVTANSETPAPRPDIGVILSLDEAAFFEAQERKKIEGE